MTHAEVAIFERVTVRVTRTTDRTRVATADVTHGAWWADRCGIACSGRRDSIITYACGRVTILTIRAVLGSKTRNSRIRGEIHHNGPGIGSDRSQDQGDHSCGNSDIDPFHEILSSRAARALSFTRATSIAVRWTLLDILTVTIADGLSIWQP